MKLKPVVSLTELEFQNSCRQLANKILQEGYPDLICGIASGGDIVAKAMMQDTGLEQCPYISVKLQRPGTRVKRKVSIDFVLKKLPRACNNVLRVLEDVYREYMFTRKPPSESSRSVEISGSDRILITNSHRILIIDDAVDTGATLSAIVKSLKSIAPQAEITSAAITVTFANPLIQPSYSLFKQALVRFPWSLDA